jgi:RNA polymerase sigma factor for flagellar operon FliA
MEPHLPLVRKIASLMGRRIGRCVEVDDLVNFGVMGLADALRKFDPARGVKFETYCLHRVRGAIQDGLRRWDHVSRKIRAKATHLEKQRRELEQVLCRPPSEMELARHLGLGCQRLMTILRQVAPASPSSHVAINGIGDIEDRSRNGHLERRDTAFFVLSRLPLRARWVLAIHFLEDMSFRAISQAIGLSPGRIGQIHQETLGRLRRDRLARSGGAA